MRGRVLVTRPEPAAARTAARLAALGFEAIVLPLTQIQALPAPEPGGDFDAVVATSANALRCLDAGLAARLCPLPLFAVGAQTEAAARRQGFCAVTAGTGNAEALAPLIGSSPARRIAYLCGSVRLSGLEEALRRQGRAVQVIETYETRRIAYDEPALAARIGAPVDAALLYSALAASAFGAMVAMPLLAGARCFCLSARIAQALPPSAAAGARIAAEPAETALLELLAAAMPR